MTLSLSISVILHSLFPFVHHFYIYIPHIFSLVLCLLFGNSSCLSVIRINLARESTAALFICIDAAASGQYVVKSLLSFLTKLDIVLTQLIVVEPLLCSSVFSGLFLYPACFAPLSSGVKSVLTASVCV